ncbi:hypothetical protein [Bacillus cereus]|uniref:Uncharacterized protein n=1 Tax=Bacillus cereus VD184 TaxID=1053242 RepID=A0A9W5VPG8_BACCE|nr:hypothetical protein [Bacillus cereus]EOQ00971.1 hypothetical protein IKC_06169 [Bacillus cereus VD184]
MLYFGYCYDEEGEFTEMIPLENVYNEVAGEETPLLPPMCTLQQPPDGIYYPIWTGTKWKKTVENLPPQPEPIPTEIEAIKSEIEIIKQELESIKNKPIEGTVE